MARNMTARQAVKEAAARGKAAGYSAGTWAFDGNTNQATYDRALEGIEDGDPEVLDAINEPGWLSGEWGGESISELLGDVLDERPEDEHDEIMEAYETAASEAFWNEVERAARYHANPRRGRVRTRK